MHACLALHTTARGGVAGCPVLLCVDALWIATPTGPHANRAAEKAWAGVEATSNSVLHGTMLLHHTAHSTIL